MAKADFYDTLGIPRSASADEIKKAYRALARKHHPDVSKAPDAQKKFTQIQEAYDVLSDDKRKAVYDRHGHAGIDAGMGNPSTSSSGRGPHYSWSNVGGQSGSRAEDASDLSDLFETFFSARRAASSRTSSRQSRTRRHTPEPTIHELTIDFDTAAAGGTATLSVGPRTIDVKIPRAVANGAKLRVPAAATGDADVLIRLTVKPHPLFRRRPDPRPDSKSLDLEVDLPLSIPEAVFGARVAVPTLDGAVEMTVPPGAGGGKALRLKSKGLDDGATKGDLYVFPRVIAPKADDIPRKLREALEREQDAFPSPRTGGAWTPPSAPQP